MTKKNTKQILRIAFIAASISSLFFVPWLLVKAWILPLPDTIQEQVDEAIGHGFDGMIVYVDQAGKPPQYFASGWHDRESEIPANSYYFGEIIKNRRKELKLSQNELAQRIGKQRPYISRIENGEDIRISNLALVANALDLSIEVTAK